MREENMELLKRLRQLKQDKADLTREFRKRKEKNGALKASLERDMEKYEVRCAPEPRCPEQRHLTLRCCTATGPDGCRRGRRRQRGGHG